MDSLLKPCQQCNKPMNGGVYRAAHICPHCFFEHEGGKARSRKAPKPAVAAAQNEPVNEVNATPEPTTETTQPASTAADVVLTAKSADEQNVETVLEQISAECVLDVELKPEHFKDGKFVGGKSEEILAALKQGKKHSLTKLREAAHEMEANMVTDVGVKNALKLESTSSARVTVKAAGTAVINAAEEALEA